MTGFELLIYLRMIKRFRLHGALRRQVWSGKFEFQLKIVKRK